MLLYRARTLASRPRRNPAFQGNGPEIRVQGRWFTSDLHAAIAHKETLEGASEIVSVEVPDAIADTFRVATTPRTRCGLSPIDFSVSPETDYVLSMFIVVEAEALADGSRKRDYLFENTSTVDARTDFRRRMAEIADELPLAA